MTEATCRYCGIQLPLREARGQEHEEVWTCRNCGSANYGLFDPFARSTIRYNCGFGAPSKRRRRGRRSQLALLA